jgi:hypothetical protein
MKIAFKNFVKAKGLKIKMKSKRLMSAKVSASELKVVYQDYGFA